MDKKRSMIFYAAVLGFALLTAGCAATREPEVNTAATMAMQEQNDENVRKMLDAFLKNDAKTFIGALPDEMRSQFDVREFENARANLTETLGQPVSYSFDTTLEHPLLLVSVWKVRFERRDSESGTIHQEVLFRVVSGVLDDEPRIISFNFL